MAWGFRSAELEACVRPVRISATSSASLVSIGLGVPGRSRDFLHPVQAFHSALPSLPVWAPSHSLPLVAALPRALSLSGPRGDLAFPTPLCHRSTRRMSVREPAAVFFQERTASSVLCLSSVSPGQLDSRLLFHGPRLTVGQPHC